MLRSAHVPTLHEQFNHLAGRLLRDAEVIRHIHHRCVASTDADEGKSMGWPDVGEAALDNPRLYPINELRGGTQQKGCGGESGGFGHLVSLTEWSIQLIIWSIYLTIRRPCADHQS